MSSSIDERVVSIRFDNSNFEEKVQQTLNSLQKLDNSVKNLDFSKVGLNMESSLKNVSDAASSVDLSSVGKGLDESENRFGAFDAFVTGIFFKLGEAALDFGKKLVDMVFLDNLKAGFSKYEGILTSQMTLTAALGDTAENQEQIADSLNKLTWYADETSYSLEDMTNNVAQFTNYGIDLKDAEQAMIGIANASAKSGAPLSMASHAMQGFSKAMGQGYMSYGNWRTWINNSKIATTDFKNTILETAKEVAAAGGDIGQAVYKDGELFVDLGKQAGGLQKVTTENLEAGLTKGKWMTKDIMIKSLSKYSAAVDDIYDQYEKTGKSVTEIVRNSGEELDQFSLEAFQYAQQCKTLSEVIDSMGDAISTQWFKIFQALIGDYKQTVELWSDVAEYVYEWFVYPLQDVAEFIIDFAKTTNDAGKSMRDLIVESVYNIFDAINSVLNPIKEAFAEIFMPEGLEGLGPKLQSGIEWFNNFTKSLILTEEKAEKLKNVFKFIFSMLKNVIEVLKTLLGIIKNLFVTLKKIFVDFDFSSIKTFISSIGESFRDLGVHIDTSPFEKFADKLKEVTDKVKEFGQSLKDALGKIKTIFTESKEDFDITKAFGFSKEEKFPFLDRLVNGAKKARTMFESLKENLVKIRDGFTDFIEKYDIGSKLKEAFNIDTLTKLFTGLMQLFLGKSLIDMANNFSKFLTTIGNSLLNFNANITAGSITGNTITAGSKTASIAETIKTLAEAILMISGAVLILGSMNVDSLKSGIASLGAIVGIISGLFASLYKLTSMSKASSSISEAITSALDSTIGSTAQMKAVAKVVLKAAVAILILVFAFSYLVDSIKDVSIGTWIKALVTLGIISGIILGFFIVIKKIASIPMTMEQARALKSIGSVLLLISMSINIIVNSLVKLMKTINALTAPKAWQDAILTLVIILGAVALLMFEAVALSKLITPKQAKTLNKIGTAMILISISIKLISSSFIKIMESINGLTAPKAWQDAILTLVIIIGTIALLMVEMTIVSKVLTKKQAKTLNKIGTAMVLIAMSIKLIASSFVNIMESINALTAPKAWQDALLTLGIIIGAVALLMVEMTIVSKVLTKKQAKVLNKIGTAMVLIAMSIKIIASSFIEIMESINGLTAPKAWQDALLTFGIILGAVALLMFEMGIISKILTKKQAKTLNKIGIAMVLISVSVKIITDSFTNLLESLNNVDPGTANKAMIIMGVLLAVIIGIMVLFAALSKSDGGASLMGAAKAFDAMAIGVLAIAAAIYLLVKAMNIAVKTLILIGENVKAIIKGFEALKEVIPIMQQIMIAFIDAIITGGINAVAHSIVRIVQIIVDGIVALLAEIAKAGPKILDAVGKIMPVVTKILTMLLQSLFTILNDSMPQFREWLLNLLELVEEILGDLVAFLLDEILPQLEDAIIKFVHWLGYDLAPMIIDSLGNIFNEIINFFTNTIFPGLKKLWAELLDLIHDLVLEFLSYLERSVTDWGNKIIDIIVALIKVIENGVNKITKALESLLLTIADNVYSYFKTGGKVLAKLLLIPKAIAEGFVEELKKQFGLDKDGSTKEKGTLWTIGKNIVEGLINGITKFIGSIGKTAKEMAKKFIEAITGKDALDEKSPSRKLFGIGEYAGEGFINGVKSTSNGVKKAAKSLSDSFLKPMTKDMDSFSASTSSMFAQLAGADMDVNPTITPIFDMSNWDLAKKEMTGEEIIIGSENGISKDFDPKEHAKYGLLLSANKTMESKFLNNAALSAEEYERAKALFEEINSKLLEKMNETGPQANEVNYNYNQYNYSPKALSEIEIYRRTNNQLNFRKFVGG